MLNHFRCLAGGHAADEALLVVDGTNFERKEYASLWVGDVQARQVWKAETAMILLLKVLFDGHDLLLLPVRECQVASRAVCNGIHTVRAIRLMMNHPNLAPTQRVTQIVNLSRKQMLRRSFQFQ
eukprot:572376-Rhodomonas_salina.1